MQDNQAFRALFALPPLQVSASTDLIVPETPAPKNETGDRELDAVLWLRDCIKTAHPALIERALTAFKAITTPADAIEKRYRDYLVRASGGNPVAALFGGFGFANLESLARDTMERQGRKDEAISRFGSVDALFALTPAESACRVALKGLRRHKDPLYGYDSDKARARFLKHPELVPSTISDCLHALDYEEQLYRLRAASVEMCGDHWHEFQEHVDYCFSMLAEIKPRTRAEAMAVFEYLETTDSMDREEGSAIVCNLVASGWD